VNRAALQALAAAAWVAAASAAVAQGGNAARGESLYAARCGACHAPHADRVGPRHQGVVGRKAGAVSGFDYSPALRASPLVWDIASLERWLADPEAVIPGQRMAYRLGDATERSDIAAYLATLR
jgi:cytochrome c